MQNKILISGFDPFGGEPINPACELLRLMSGKHLEGYRIVTQEIPTARFRAIEILCSAITREDPAMIIALGQSGGCHEIAVERVAINVDDYRIPDNDGNQPLAQRIEEDGPDAYFSTLPVRAMAKAMNDAGIPAEVSFTAGTYVCNDMLYRLMHAIATDHPGVRGGFMHVPYATQQATRLPSATPSMSLETMTAGIALAVGAALATERDVSVSAGTTH